MFLLTNPWVRYAWGSVDLLPALLHRRPDGRPVAEIWMGAHPALPSTIEVGGEEVGLDEYIEQAPERALGADVVAQSGPQLPFMMKLLAAGQPLSLQVHPDRAQAAEGFRRENEQGIALSDPRRNYRDDQHKPEVLYALTPFEMICGLRETAQVREALVGLEVAELIPVVAALDADDSTQALRSALTLLLTADVPRQRAITRAVVASAAARSETRAEYGLVRDLAERFPHDIAIVAALFLNHLVVQPGESIYIAAGVLHSYIRGLGIEVEASSDNVLRAGLTTKHIDVPELLRLVNYSPGEPERLRPTVRDGATVFSPPVQDFALWTYSPATPAEEETLVTLEGPTSGARLIACCAGHCTLVRPGERLVLARGEAAFVPDSDGPISISASGTVTMAFGPGAAPVAVGG